MSLYPILKDGRINLKQASDVSSSDEVIIYQNGVPLTATINQIIGTGWAYYDDSEYTQASPLNINNDTVQITIDGLGGFTEKRYLPLSVKDFWVNNKIDPENIGDAYSFRFDFVAVPSGVSDTFIVQVDIGDGSPNVILSDTIEINKSSGVAENFNYSAPIFSLATFNANNAKIMIQTDDDIDFYNFGIFIQRIHREN